MEEEQKFGLVLLLMGFTFGVLIIMLIIFGILNNNSNKEAQEICQENGYTNFKEYQLEGDSPLSKKFNWIDCENKTMKLPPEIKHTINYEVNK